MCDARQFRTFTDSATVLHAVHDTTDEHCRPWSWHVGLYKGLGYQKQVIINNVLSTSSPVSWAVTGREIESHQQVCEAHYLCVVMEPHTASRKHLYVYVRACVCVCVSNKWWGRPRHGLLLVTLVVCRRNSRGWYVGMHTPLLEWGFAYNVCF